MKKNLLTNAMPLIAAGLADKLNVKISIGGSEAFTDGLKIQLPNFEIKDEKSKQAILGYLSHEAAHIKYESFKDIDKGVFSEPLLKDLWNIFEDVRIENCLITDYIGCQKWLDETLNQIDMKADTKSPINTLFSFVLLYSRCFHRNQPMLLNEANIASKALEELIGGELFGKLKALIDSDMKKISSSYGALNLAREVINLLQLDNSDQSDSSDKSSDSDKSDQSDQSDSSDKSGNSDKSDQSDQSDSSDKSSDSDKSDQSDQSDSSDKSGNSDNSDQSGQSDSSDKSGDSDKSDNSDQSGQSDSSDKSGDSDKSDNSDQSGQSDSSDKSGDSDKSDNSDQSGQSDSSDKSGDSDKSDNSDQSGQSDSSDKSGDSDKSATKKEPTNFEIKKVVKEILKSNTDIDVDTFKAFIDGHGSDC
ncbi:hypothetical protein [Psychromonas sp. KJ10-2]|uniref:hypothetical protein n=1 Tax=Psychromonas sp. KJ10-2 TaxID=3391822 RepID=UPI0039B38611